MLRNLYKGNLHTHTSCFDNSKTNILEFVNSKTGSNCGVHSLETIVKYYSKNQGFEYIAITDHSRDPAPDEAYINFLKHYKDNSDTIYKDYKELLAAAYSYSYYADERIKKNIEAINNLSLKALPLKIIKGIEVSILPDGNFDTEYLEDIDLVIASYHPYNKTTKPYLNNDEKHSKILISGAKNPKTNILGHPGRDSTYNTFINLYWEKIAEECIVNNVAIEINVRDAYYKIYEQIRNMKTEYLAYIKNNIINAIPILNNEIVMNKLKPFIKEGLKFTINNDEHYNYFISENNEILSIDYRFIKTNLLLSETIEVLLEKYEIDYNQIINTYPLEKLIKFLRKK